MLEMQNAKITSYNFLLILKRIKKSHNEQVNEKFYINKSIPIIHVK